MNTQKLPAGNWCAATYATPVSEPNRALLPIDEEFAEPYMEPPFFDPSPRECAVAAIVAVAAAAASAVFPWGFA